MHMHVDYTYVRTYVHTQVKEILQPFGALKAFSLAMDTNTQAQQLWFWFIYIDHNYTGP